MNLSDTATLHESISVRVARASDDAAWESYVVGCPEATFFHRIGWRHIIEKVFRHRTHYLVAECGSTIVGVLPLAQVRSRLFGHSLASLPFAAYGGAASSHPTATAALHAAARRLTRAHGGSRPRPVATAGGGAWSGAAPRSAQVSSGFDPG